MRKEFSIGLITIIAIAALILGINFLKGRNLFKVSNTYFVNFDNVNGLSKASPIYANGYKIGTVRNIIYDYQRPGNVVVEIEIEDAMRFPDRTVAQLQTEMLGTVRMNILFPYSPDSQFDGYLVPGDTLQGYVDKGFMHTAESKIMPLTDSLLPKVDSVLINLNRLLADPALKQTLHNAARMTDELARTGTKLNSYMQHDLPALTARINQLAENLNTLSTELNAIDYGQTIAKVNETIDQVNGFAKKLNQKDNTLGLLLNDTVFYRNLTTATENAATLLNDMKQNPRRYVHFSVFGKKKERP